MSQEKKRKILITSALPYANGDIHIGHLVEHVITDFWSRFQKMQGHECLTLCADDTHGAATMIEAKKQNLTPKEHIQRVYERHVKDLKDFHIHYDEYSSTDTDENEKLCQEFFKSMVTKGHIEAKSLEQLYCFHDKMFLPDRFVKGTCPKCQSKDQYGDSCDKCSAVYNPVELLEPFCHFCGNTPRVQESEHLFVRLNDFKSYLEGWVPEHCSPAIWNKLKEWFNEDLRPWCLTRDEPYFGFEIEGHPKKYFYVWFDAPIGYISTTEVWCKKNNKKLEDYWKNPSCEIYHNIGKDIIYFHSLFWPCMLEAAGYNTPKEIMTHGMLTVNGEKLSKSKGTFINARTYLNHLNPEHYRFYLAAKLSDSIADIDLNLEDFINKVNSDLVGKITNIASRSVPMLHKNFEGALSQIAEDGMALIQEAQGLSETIAAYYEAREFSKAMIEIRNLADSVNKYFDERTPWKLVKTDLEKTQEILTTVLNAFRIMAIYLKPMLPIYAEKVETLFNARTPWMWSDVQSIVVVQTLQPYERLSERVELALVEKMMEESKQMKQIKE